MPRKEKMEASGLGDAERRARTAAWLAWSLWGLVMIVFAAGLVLRLWNGSALTSSLEGADYLSEILLCRTLRLRCRTIRENFSIRPEIVSWDVRPPHLGGMMCVAYGSDPEVRLI
jgi:hypothetical protein